MNKNIKNIVVAAILLVGMVAMIVYVIGSRTESAPTECSPPALPQGVPTDAYWAGGCAGGSWIYMVENGNNEYHFQVFTDRQGKLQIDAQFVPDSAVTVDLNRSNWKDYKLYYQEGMDSLVYITVASPTDTMTLHSTYPAFGGTVWEGIKDAQELQGTYDNIPTPKEK